MSIQNIRNFVIIAHIDHGKSTLSDRFLEITGSVRKEKIGEQFLDSMDLEREKGITIKMHPVRLIYKPQSQISNIKSQNLQGEDSYILNLIDTPGHIDFSYEISRALACVEGAILLVDALKGIQAQTIYNLEQAQKQNLKIIPAINKIDMADDGQITSAKEELGHILQVSQEDILLVSGKTGQGVEEMIKQVIAQIPCPEQKIENDLPIALIFDSKYDPFSGVLAYVRIFNGSFKKNDKLFLMAQKNSFEAKEVGYFTPSLMEADCLSSGNIGYIKTGIKDPAKVKVGDTISVDPRFASNFSSVKQLPGYEEPKFVLYLTVYPANSDGLDLLKDSLEKLKLNDSSLDFYPESKTALGRGYRIGFLGSLHAEITIRRLENEFGLELIATSPQVVFEVIFKNNEKIVVASPSAWPEQAKIEKILEPWSEIEIVVPNQYFGALFKIFENFQINLEHTSSLSEQKSLLFASAPTRKIVSGDFYDQLKSATQGYASFSFKSKEMKEADLIKMEILIAGRPEEPFAKIVGEKEAFFEGKRFLQKLKKIMPPQQFPLILQASLGGKIIARETISALRKDVTAPLYGGDVTRKKKLLEIQKKGKKELLAKAKVNIPSRVFLEALKD